jgi:hypothetical protein
MMVFFAEKERFEASLAHKLHYSKETLKNIVAHV